MRKIEFTDCEAYLKTKKIKKNIKAQILDFEYDENIDENLMESELLKLSSGLPMELWTIQMVDYIYKKKSLGNMWKKIRDNYSIDDTFNEIELYKEEQAYLWQLGKASINRKSMKAVTNYLIDSLNCSFLLIGECQDTAKLMDMLYELRKNPNEIVDIINFVCCGENKVIYLLQGNDGASLICFSV